MVTRWATLGSHCAYPSYTFSKRYRSIADESILCKCSLHTASRFRVPRAPIIMAPKIFRVVHALLRPVVDLREQQAPVVVSVGIIRLERTTFALQSPAHINTYTYKQTTMSNFVPTQFTSFTDNFDFDKLKVSDWLPGQVATALFSAPQQLSRLNQ